MSILKILPTAVDQTANYSFNTVTSNNMVVGSVNVYNSIVGANANIALLFSVNDYQNTTITNVNTYATSAYGQANIATTLAQAAFNYANTLISDTQIDPIARANANAALATANTSSANTIYTQGVDTTQNTNISLLQGAMTSANANIVQIFGITSGQNAYSQAAFSAANTAASNTLYTQGVDATQNTNITTANNAAWAAFAAGNTNATNITAVNTYAGSGYALSNTNSTQISIIQGVDNTQNTNITTADAKAQAAFNTANTKFNSSGGTISGDTVVSGNLTVTGTTFYANTVNLNIEDNIITLNSNVTGVPTSNAGIEINRGAYANTKLLWSEANNSWEFTNNGITYDKIASQTYANASYAQANTGTTLAQAAFDSANVIAGVNTTQNTNITTANNAAWAAFSVANSASSNTIYTQGVDVSQNTRLGIIEAVNVTQNTNITTATVLAQAAFDKANTGVSTSIDQYARDTANLASSNTVYIQSVNSTQNNNINFVNTFAGSAFANANAALATANIASANTIYTQGVDVTQNTNIGLAYGQANTATVLAQAAFDKANTGTTSSIDNYARTTANSAITLAQDAYNYANTLTGGGSGNTSGGFSKFITPTGNTFSASQNTEVQLYAAGGVSIDANATGLIISSSVPFNVDWGLVSVVPDTTAYDFGSF